MFPYEVHAVDDAEMPVDHDWILVRTAFRTKLFIKRSKVGPKVIAGAWAACRILERSNSAPTLSAV